MTGGRTRVGFCEDAQFVGGGELSTMGARGNLGIRGRRRRTTINRGGLHETIHATHSAASFPALYTNFRCVAVSLYIGRKGPPHVLA